MDDRVFGVSVKKIEVIEVVAMHAAENAGAGSAIAFG
jgi:hypothetical protein